MMHVAEVRDRADPPYNQRGKENFKMPSESAVKRQVVTGPSDDVDNEDGRTILVAVGLTDSKSGKSESTFKLKNTTSPPGTVTYKSLSQNFQIQFPAGTTVPVQLAPGLPGTQCPNTSGCFQGVQQTDGSYQLVLQALNQDGIGKKSKPGNPYPYTITLLGQTSSEDPTMDIEC